MTKHTTTTQSVISPKSTGSGYQSKPVQGGKPLRVLFVNDHLGFADGVIHGPARYFLNVLPRFDLNTVVPSLCILRDWHPFAEQLEKAGLSPIFFNRKKWDPRAVMDIVRLINTHHIDVLHLMGMKGCLLGRIAARMTGTPCVIHLHDINPVIPPVRFIQRKLTPWTNMALAVSGAVRTFAIQQFALPEERVVILHNPIDTSVFSAVTNEDRRRIRQEFDIPKTTQVIGIVARLSPEKGHIFFIQAFAEVLQNYPDVILLIVGDGPMRGECEKLVNSLGIVHAVRFLGHREDIPQLVSIMDFEVVPSLREGFSIAALEALAAGKPVIASNVGGIPDVVIDNETGFLVEPNNRGAMSNAIKRLLGNPQLLKQQGDAGKRHAECFTMEHHMMSLTDVYEKVANERENRMGHPLERG